MKKKMIAAGAASLALAAMPVVGVFADTQATVTDTVTLTVSPTCKMEATAAAATYNLGTSTVAHEYAAVTGTPMTITCNAQAGWTLTAAVTALTATGTTQTIPFGAYSTSGESVWSAQMALSGNDTTNASLGTEWNDFTLAKTFAGDLSISTVASGNANSAVSGLIITPSYKAYGAAHQAAGSYSGTITYTFNDLTSSGNSGNQGQ
ncbi:hypothetical protein IKD57_01790 [Candidatus Saccharibacteria bacterium]|nr:hypothetical protein [Candidatus Saccharibacteria bacterium]